MFLNIIKRNKQMQMRDALTYFNVLVAVVKQTMMAIGKMTKNQMSINETENWTNRTTGLNTQGD